MATSPAVIGRYQVVRRLGTGGMGSVYLARDPELDRMVAIKLVKDDLTDDPELRERFSREARSAARLRHPNIITMFDIGEYEGRPFIAMEYIPGQSLSELLHRQPQLDLPWVLWWTEGLCDGLAHAHKAGVVHRDIKPANMMIDGEGGLKIVDFGIARIGDSSMTRSGVLVGTACYMAPEQLLGSHADHRADIFAVGAVFWELIAGRKAFPGTIADGLFNRICNEPHPPLTGVRDGLDAEIIRVVDKALQKDPAQRYQDMSAMGADIARLRARLPEAAITSPFSMGDTTVTSISPGTGSGGLTPRPGTTPGLSPTPRFGTTPGLSPTPRPGTTPGLSPTPRPGTTPGFSPTPRATPRPTSSQTNPYRTAGTTPTPDETQSQRRHRAEIFIDAAEMALHERDFTKARKLLDDAARFDPDSPTLRDIRLQVEDGESAEKAAEQQRQATELALDDASACVSRGEFTVARQHLDRILTIEPGNFRAQALLDRLRKSEIVSRGRPVRGASVARTADSGVPWLRIIVIIAIVVSLAAVAYLATR